MPTHRKPTSWLFANFETISLWTPECEFSRVSSNPLTRRKIFAEMVVTDLFDEGLYVTSIFDKKNIIFSDDFHGIWESLIFDSDVKAQVRKHFNYFLNLCCFWYWDHDCDIFFSFFSFTADKLCNDNITLLRQAWNNRYSYVFYTLDRAKIVI